MLEILIPPPQAVEELPGEFARPHVVRITAPTTVPVQSAARALEDDMGTVCGICVAANAEFTVSLDITPCGLKPEGYTLELSAQGATLRGADAPGIFYATQTLLQILALAGPQLPCLRIEDWPHYRTRSLMIDMGRAPFTPALIRRVIRIMARLKLNSLHMHLYDDHLNSVRFENLPLGSENPMALPVAEYAGIVRYARRHHVSIVPEFECWGHAGSILHHYPSLYGAPGMWEGFSFGIGEQLYDLLERMIGEFVPVLEPECVFHVGLDEANWALLPGVKEEDRGRYSPTLHVQRLYEILQRAGERHGRRITMRLWADHGGRPIPGHLRDKVIIEPWMYFEGRDANIREKVAAYAGEGKPRFMMGGGMSSLHFDGHYGATRAWCREAMNAPNCEGINICVWESNDIARRMIGIYGGAMCAWKPGQPDPDPNDRHSEWQRGKLQQTMRRWQAAFPDADPNAIDADRGPEVNDGLYCWPPLAGIPVAPTALLVDPRTVDAFHESEANAATHDSDKKP